MENEMKTCKKCQEQINKKAKRCPHCGAKQRGPIGFIILGVIVLIVIIIIVTSGKSDKEEKDENTNAKEEVQQENIEYTPYRVKELMDDLQANAMNASDKYKGQYVELTGALSNIDAQGSYISLEDETDDFALDSVQCFIKNETTTEAVKKLSSKQIVTVRGKITDVGEVLGYSLDIDEIVLDE